MDPYNLRPATLTDLPLLASIERSAASLFLTIPALSHLASGPTLPSTLLASLSTRSLLWVATSSASPSSPIAFLAVNPLDDCLHVLEVSVAVDHGRKGLGRRLMRLAEGEAISRGLNRMTLMTDREAEWNRPWYQSLGYREVESGELGREHVEKRREEGMGEAGLDLRRRCVMVKDL